MSQIQSDKEISIKFMRDTFTEFKKSQEYDEILSGASYYPSACGDEIFEGYLAWLDKNMIP